MEESYYLKALEYSANKSFDGVTFLELREYTEKKFGKRFTPESLLTFLQFVMDTHYWTSSQVSYERKKNKGTFDKFLLCFQEEFGVDVGDIGSYYRDFNQYTKTEKYYLNSEGDKRLLEFYELREARMNANQAYKISLIAIGISLLALFISPLIEKMWEYILN